MNKKFLSLLLLGLAIHSLSFSSAIGDGSDNESIPGVHSSLAEALTGEEVDWSSVFATIGLNQRPQEMDAATVMTEMPHGEKTKKKKKRGNKSELPAVFNYLPEVDTASTQKELRDLQRKYVALRRPILDKPDKKRTTNDKKNLQALADAFKYIETRLTTLQKAQGQAKIEAREAGEAVLAEARKKAEEAKVLLEKERQQKEKEKKEQEKEMLEGSGRKQDNINIQEYRKSQLLRSLLEVATGGNNSTTKTMPQEFNTNQINPYQDDIYKIFWLFTGFENTVEVHACPVCGTINDTPCTIICPNNLNIEETPHLIELKAKFDEIIKCATEENAIHEPVVLKPNEPNDMPIYRLFSSLIDKEMKAQESFIPLRSIGQLAFRFRELLPAQFQHKPAS